MRWCSPISALFLTLASGLGASSCMATRPTSPVLLATEPPGAVVVVNGKSSGFVTPCMIGLSVETPHRVELQFAGYQSETRMIAPAGYEQAILWHQMNIGHKSWRWPLWLNIDDFFIPVRSKATLQPARIFVRMRRTVDE